MYIHYALRVIESICNRMTNLRLIVEEIFTHSLTVERSGENQMTEADLLNPTDSEEEREREREKEKETRVSNAIIRYNEISITNNSRYADTRSVDSSVCS